MRPHSEAANLAVHALAYLAAAGPERRVSAAEIGHALGRSSAHLAKVLPRLAARGWLESSRGVKGGYRLACRPQQIGLIEVIEAFEGPQREGGCILGDSICRPGTCLFDARGDDLQARLDARLRATTIGDFVPRVSLGVPAGGGRRPPVGGRARSSRRSGGPARGKGTEKGDKER